MSLWTPGGEHEVPRGGAAAPAPDADTPDAYAGLGDDFADLGPEDRARAEAIAQEMAQVRAQLQSVPAAVVVANHAMGLYELAAIHLSSQPPNFDEAHVAVDAFGALVEAVADRLGPDGSTLRDALSQIRLAYVQMRAGAEGGEPAAAEPPAGD